MHIQRKNCSRSKMLHKIANSRAKKQDESVNERSAWCSFITGFIFALFDILLVVIVGGLSFSLFTGIIPTYQRGFYCNDPSIGYPFFPNTVSVKVLLTVSIGVPIVIIDIVECFILWKFSPQISRHDVCSRKIRRYFSNTTSLICEYLLGLVVVIALMEFGKASSGRLRPHFLTVCQPNWTATPCESDPVAFVQDAHCLQNDPNKLRQARHSFPSGHAAVATYSWLFLAIYLRHVLNSMVLFDALSKCIYFKNFLVFCYGVFAVVCCVTRVTDFWHHPTDVVAGAAMGLGISWVLFSRTDSSIKQARMVWILPRKSILYRIIMFTFRVFKILFYLAILSVLLVLLLLWLLYRNVCSLGS